MPECRRVWAACGGAAGLTRPCIQGDTGQTPANCTAGRMGVTDRKPVPGSLAQVITRRSLKPRNKPALYITLLVKPCNIDTKYYTAINKVEQYTGIKYYMVLKVAFCSVNHADFFFYISFLLTLSCYS